MELATCGNNEMQNISRNLMPIALIIRDKTFTTTLKNVQDLGKVT